MSCHEAKRFEVLAHTSGKKWPVVTGVAALVVSEAVREALIEL